MKKIRRQRRRSKRREGGGRKPVSLARRVQPYGKALLSPLYTQTPGELLGTSENTSNK